MTGITNAMSPLELARSYMEIFFSGERMERLAPLLADDFTFRGPLYGYDSADACIRALREAPAEGCRYSILYEYENDTSACLVYRFTKRDISVPMAQNFATRNGKICSILLVFDAREFT